MGSTGSKCKEGRWCVAEVGRKLEGCIWKGWRGDPLLSAYLLPGLKFLLAFYSLQASRLLKGARQQREHIFPNSTQLTSNPTQHLYFTCHLNSPQFSQVFMFNYHNTLSFLTLLILLCFEFLSGFEFSFCY